MASVVSIVRQNNVRMLNILVAIPGSVPSKDLNEGLLLAAKEGYTECVDCLIKAGADIDTTDNSDQTPFYLAVCNNKIPSALFLLKAGNECDALANNGFAAIHIAVKKNLHECVRTLLENGIKINSRDSQNNTPLILAVANKKYLVVEELLSHPDCDVNAQNSEGWTALHYAAHMAAGVDILLSAGANPNLYNEDGNTPLMLAAIEGFSKVVNKLAKAKCDVNMKDKSDAQKTAMHTIALKGHTECIADLLEAGMDMNMFDNQYRTPLWYALNSGRYSAVQTLLKFSGHIDSFHCPKQAPRSSCPVWLAFNQGALQIIKQFILTGFDKEHIRSCLLNPEEFGLQWNETEKEMWFLYAHQPLSLQQLSRIWIRHHLGHFFYQNLNKLPVPKFLRDFLLMKDIDEIL